MQKSPRIKENIIQVFPQKIKQRALSNSVASSNLQIMKWNDWIERYHHLKQTHLINNSFNSVNTFFRQKKERYGIQIDDVPYVQSEQMDLSTEKRENHEVKSIQTILKRRESEQSFFTQDEDIEIKEYIEKKQTFEDAGSQNFTDQQDNDESLEQIQVILHSKKEEKSTNKNSGVDFKWDEDINLNNLKKTACFLEEPTLKIDLNPILSKENINLANGQGHKNVAQKYQRKKEFRKILKEDKKYLGKVINKSKK